MSDEFPNKYYVDETGKYLGQYSGYIVDDSTNDDGNVIPRHMVYAYPDDQNAIEISIAPDDGRQIYDFQSNTFSPL